jgi:hypothetical protein
LVRQLDSKEPKATVESNLAKGNYEHNDSVIHRLCAYLKAYTRSILPKRKKEGELEEKGLIS